MKGGGFLAVGPPAQVMTEANLKTIYGIDVRMVAVTGDDGISLVRAAVALPRAARKGA